MRMYASCGILGIQQVQQAAVSVRHRWGINLSPCSLVFGYARRQLNSADLREIRIEKFLDGT